MTGSSLSLMETLSFTRSMSLLNSTMNISGGLKDPISLTIDNSTVTVDGPINVTGTLTLKNNSILTHSATTTTNQYKLDITAGSISVELGSKIDVSGKGYPEAHQGGNATNTGMMPSQFLSSSLRG